MTTRASPEMERQIAAEYAAAGMDINDPRFAEFSRQWAAQVKGVTGKDQQAAWNKFQSKQEMSKAWKAYASQLGQPSAPDATCPHCGKSLGAGPRPAGPLKPAPYQTGRAEPIQPPATT